MQSTIQVSDQVHLVMQDAQDVNRLHVLMDSEYQKMTTLATVSGNV